MKNPLAVFTGAALATLAVLAGVSMTNWPGGPPDAQKPAEAAIQTKDAEEAANTPSEQQPAAGEAVAPEKPAEIAAIPAPEPPKAQAQAKPELDTVRVESDGQAIVAGRAKPGAEIALKLGEEVIGKGLANSEGAWVVVPDQPLPKGAHEITIEQQEANTAPVAAEQSIAVAVPEKPDQQAMVALTEPGAATKVLQAGGSQEQASLTETAQKGTEQPKAAETVENQAAEKPAETAEPSGQQAEPAPETTVAKIEVPDPVAPPPEMPAPAESALPKAEGNTALGLDAVDYNDKGDIIFSGRAGPGTAVRLYVDNRAVGDAMVNDQGKWTFAGKDIIAPGTHNLRADQIDKGGKVIARVELPFLRENAEAVAALTADAAPEKVEAEPPKAGETQAEADQPAQATAQSASEPPQPTAEPPAETTAAQPETTTPQVTAEQSQTTTAEPTPKVASEEATAAESTPQIATEQPTTAAAEQPKITEAEPTPDATAKQPDAGAPKPSQVAEAEPPPPSEQPAAADKKEKVTTTAAVEQGAKAIDAGKPHSGKIVIQPGNSLWKLSRVIYGRGLNFTVIYQANKDQIRNPNRIYPGQIFAIPGALPPETIDPQREEPLTSAEGGAAQ